MWAFAKSVLLGTAAGAALPSVVTFAIALASLPAGLDGDGRLVPLLWLALLPVMVTLPVVLGASILFGLPLTALLRRLRAETGGTYAVCGGAIGFAIPFAAFLVSRSPDGYWIAGFGAASGTLTAHSWWRFARAPSDS